MNNIHSPGRRVACATGAAIAVALLGGYLPRLEAAVDSKNLLRNGGFEEPGAPPPGWRVQNPAGSRYELVDGAMTGAKALKLVLPVAGTATLTSDPMPVTVGEHYLLTFWHRADGMSVTGGHEGCDAAFDLTWRDAEGRAVLNNTITLNYRALPNYVAATHTAQAPVGAVTVVFHFWLRVGAAYQGPPSAQIVDQVRFARLTPTAIPAGARKWTYLKRMPASGLRMVPDPGAADGQALLAPVATAPRNATLTWGQYTMDQSVGDYLAVFRLKVGDNTKAEPVAHLGIDALGSANGYIAGRTLLATDFEAPGVYQEFPLRFVRPEDGALSFIVDYSGAADLTFDKTTVVKLGTFATDREQAAIWLGEEEEPRTGGGAVEAATPGTNAHVLVLAGLGHQTYFPAAVSNDMPGATFSLSYLLKNNLSGFALDKPFPRNVEQLSRTDVIVLANVPVAALNGLMGRRALRQFVARGGGLLVFGGPWSLGGGEVAGTVLESVLPVETTGPWNMAKTKSKIVDVARPSPLTADLHWDRKPLVYYCRRTTARPGAETCLQVNGMPLLVTGHYGKGRVAVFAGTYLGASEADEVLFYEWTDYPILLCRVLQWLLVAGK